VADAVVDASVWVSRASQRDPAHERTIAWFDRQAREGAVHAAPVIVLAEVAGALARTSRSSELGLRVVTRLVDLPRLRLLAIDASIGLRAGEIAADLRLRGADAVYVAIAERLNLPLVTWDREQRERGGSLVPTLVPT